MGLSMSSAAQTYLHMCDDIYGSGYRRKVSDARSPQLSDTYEAASGRQYVIEPYNSAVECDRRWAAANVLHFFTGDEEAGVLRCYNKHADRFLTGDRLIGAYGPIALPQLRRCIDTLTSDTQSRRAFVSMGEALPIDVNRPACWNVLHFLSRGTTLDILVYQRSLNLAVFPYDCVLFANILCFMAQNVGFNCGVVRWTIGSLHAVGPRKERRADANILCPVSDLNDASLCSRLLETGEF